MEIYHCSLFLPSQDVIFICLLILLHERYAGSATEPSPDPSSTLLGLGLLFLRLPHVFVNFELMNKTLDLRAATSIDTGVFLLPCWQPIIKISL